MSKTKSKKNKTNNFPLKENADFFPPILRICQALQWIFSRVLKVYLIGFIINYFIKAQYVFFWPFFSAVKDSVFLIKTINKKVASYLVRRFKWISLSANSTTDTKSKARIFFYSHTKLYKKNTKKWSNIYES